MRISLRAAPWGRVGGGAAIVAALLNLTGCGGTSSYALQARIQGLDASGLTLYVNGVKQNVPEGATQQTLAAALPSGSTYFVGVASQPATENCSVTNGSGTIGKSNVTDVAVSCVHRTYAVSGTVTGLTTDGLVLLDNGGDATPISANATQFSMPTPVAYGATYAVTVQTQPAGLTCTVAGGTGTMGAGGATVAVSCTTNAYTVGGTISGLTADGLVLLDNGSDANTIAAGASQFTMPSAIAYGSGYAITVQSQPNGLICTAANGTGTMGAGNVTSVAISCVSSTAVLYFFQGGSDGQQPLAPLMQATDGNFYGTTNAGGAHGDGTVYEVTAAGVESVVYTFAGSDGRMPQGGLVEDASGDFFGTTNSGGTYDWGTAFELAAGGSEAVLHSFSKGGDGAYPICSLVADSSGNLYGTTWGGGLTHGIVFEIPLGGSSQVLHSFANNSTDGGYPTSGLIRGSDGNYYGTTPSGGPSGAGTVYKITPTGTETVLYMFTGGADGGKPQGGLVQGADGNFYGTTTQGGAHGDGTLFEVTPAGTEAVLYSFAGAPSDGNDPLAGLLLASDGNFYGTTSKGGANDTGILFKMTPTGTVTILHAFAGGATDGAGPAASLIEGSDGKLYGTTASGGPNNYGTVFTVRLR